MMKTRARLVLFAMLSAAVVSVLVFQNPTYAADLTPEQLSRIQQNCLSTKASLNQLHASDALLRVNRGQIYESVGTKLMDTFNTRLANNSLDNKGLVTVAGDYQVALATFRSDYNTYERQLSNTINIDCTKDPAGFHQSLMSARTRRDQVHDDVQKLNQYISDYRSSVSDFILNFNRVSGNAS